MRAGVRRPGRAGLGRLGMPPACALEEALEEPLGARAEGGMAGVGGPRSTLRVAQCREPSETPPGGVQREP